MKVFSFLALLLIISSCTSKPEKIEPCFLLIDNHRKVDQQSPVIISNFEVPDSLLPFHSKPILVSTKEYERIQKIITYNWNIIPDTSEDIVYKGSSIYVFEDCNSKQTFHTAFNHTKSRLYLNYIIDLLKQDNARKEIIQRLSYL